MGLEPAPCCVRGIARRDQDGSADALSWGHIVHKIDAARTVKVRVHVRCDGAVWKQGKHQFAQIARSKVIDDWNRRSELSGAPRQRAKEGRLSNTRIS
jgi:hypothetical protein